MSNVKEVGECRSVETSTSSMTRDEIDESLGLEESDHSCRPESNRELTLPFVVSLYVSQIHFSAPTASATATTATARQPTDALRKNSASKLPSHTDGLAAGSIRYLSLDMNVNSP